MAIKMTQEEYDKLTELLNTVKNKTNAPGIRRLAMAEFDYIFRDIKKKQKGCQ